MDIFISIIDVCLPGKLKPFVKADMVKSSETCVEFIIKE